MSRDINMMGKISLYSNHQIRAAAVPPRNTEQLRPGVHNALHVVSQARIRRLVLNLPWRVVAVINAQGEPTRY